MGILIIAAEEEELAGIRRMLESYHVLDWRIRHAGRGIWKKRKVTLAAEGPGTALAARALAVAFSMDRFDVVLSTGYCGALDSELEAGAVIMASEVRDQASGRTFVPWLPGAPRRVAISPVVTSNRVAVTAEEKARLRATGAKAVEMEAAAVAEAAQRAGLPFACIRSVSDTAAEDMPVDFNRFRDREGRFQRGRIACAALASPVRSIPGLMRLSRNCRLASAKLGEFLADCQL